VSETWPAGVDPADYREIEEMRIDWTPVSGTVPAYSFTPEQCGLTPTVLSIACAEGRCGDCRASFRCDCQHHRR
jgi:hypothetical protein